MNVDWHSNVGRLIAGGCGTQVGLLLSCGGVAAIISLCVVCSMTNIISFGLTQEVANLAILNQFVEPVPAAESVTVTQINPAIVAVSGPTSTAAPLTPVALVREGGVNLRNGPGMEYEKVGTLSFGASMEVVGRNLDSTWWLVGTPDGLFAWVADTSVNTAHVDDSLPIVAVPAQLIQLTPQASTADAFIPATDSATTSAGEVISAIPTPTALPGNSRIFY